MRHSVQILNIRRASHIIELQDHLTDQVLDPGSLVLKTDIQEAIGLVLGNRIGTDVIDNLVEVLSLGVSQDPDGTLTMMVTPMTGEGSGESGLDPEIEPQIVRIMAQITFRTSSQVTSVKS